MTNKILIVEDTKAEAEYAKSIIERYNHKKFGNIWEHDLYKNSMKDYFNKKGKITPVFASNLEDALKVISNEKIDEVITDVFYPLGNASNKEELSEIMTSGLAALYSCNHWNRTLPSEDDMKTVKYAFSKEGNPPSGALLGLYFNEQSKMPILVTSHEHHSSIATDAILFGICRGGPLNDSYYVEGVGKNEKKNWGDALLRLADKEKKGKAIERSGTIDDYINYRKFAEAERFLELAKSSNLKKYFPNLK